MLKATEINDLIVDSEERELLWTALKERGLSAEAKYEIKEGVQVDFAILCALGNLGVLFGGEKEVAEKKELKEGGEWRYVVVPESAVRSDLNGVMSRIADEVEQLGGLAS